MIQKMTGRQTTTPARAVKAPTALALACLVHALTSTVQTWSSVWLHCKTSLQRTQPWQTWPSGRLVQMAMATAVLLGFFAVLDWQHVALSVLGAVMLNQTLATNHRKKALRDVMRRCAALRCRWLRSWFAACPQTPVSWPP